MKKLILFTLIFFVYAIIPAQCPTFTISAPSGTVVGCSPNSVPLYANNTSTLANVTYTWISTTTGTSTGNMINATAPGGLNSFTVLASSPSGTCISSQVFYISGNTSVPSMTVSPLTQTLNCNGACKTFTAVASTTTNIYGMWYSSAGTIMNPPSSSPLIICANAPGTYTAEFCNVVNGCCSSQTVAVVANTVIPTITVTPVTPNGYTITCNNTSVQMNINSGSTVAPMSYSWTNLTTSVTTTPPSGGYTVTVPGQYQASFKDGFSCTVSTTVTIFIDTIRPSPIGITNLPSNSYTLDCYNNCLVATAASNPMLPSSSYSWTVPPNLIVSTPSVSICLANVTVNPTSYTVMARGYNGCLGRQKVFFFKDLYVPYYTSVFTPTAISCASGTIAMAPYNFTGTTTPVSFTMTSPPPTSFSTTAPATFSVPGTYTLTIQNLINGCTANTTTVVPLSGPCGITELNENILFTLQPNPSNGKFYVNISGEMENGTLRIFDNTGREVYKQTISKGSNNIDVHHLAKGMYYYTVTQDEQTFFNGKILIE